MLNFSTIIKVGSLCWALMSARCRRITYKIRYAFLSSLNYFSFCALHIYFYLSLSGLMAHDHERWCRQKGNEEKIIVGRGVRGLSNCANWEQDRAAWKIPLADRLCCGNPFLILISYYLTSEKEYCYPHNKKIFLEKKYR